MPTKWTALIVTGSLWLMAKGCVLSPTAGIPNDDGDQQPPTTTPPAFTLSVSSSNDTPQLNEEVLLSCIADGDINSNLLFSFQSADVDLQVNASTGTAAFVVTGSELGQSIDVTCSVTTEDSAVIQSPRLSLFPT